MAEPRNRTPSSGLRAKRVKTTVAQNLTSESPQERRRGPDANGDALFETIHAGRARFTVKHMNAAFSAALMVTGKKKAG